MSVSSAAQQPSTSAAITDKTAGSTEHAANLSDRIDHSRSSTDAEAVTQRSSDKQTLSNPRQHQAQVAQVPVREAAGSHASASAPESAAAPANAAVTHPTAAVAPPRKMQVDHDAELDAILNVQDSQTNRPTSTVIEQPVTHEQESLEDWLDSL